FRSGYQIDGRPVAMEKWRITTGDADVAEKVASLYDAKDEPPDWETKGEDSIEVFTEHGAIDVILDGPNAIYSNMVLWSRNNKKIRSCDGVEQHDENKSPCACPSTIADRKQAAKDGVGCEPSIQIYFRLADA